MNIKKMDPFKQEMKGFIELLPLDKMEFDIQDEARHNPYLMDLYNNLLLAEKHIESVREACILHNFGLCGLYVFLDVVYAEPLHWILRNSPIEKIKALEPQKWRINKEFRRRHNLPC